MDDVAGKLANREFSAALLLLDAFQDEDAKKDDLLIIRCSILNSAGRTTEAIKIANEIIKANPNNTDALMILADAALIDGKTRDRRNYLERIIKADPKYTRALNDLANISLGSRNLKAAADYFDKALAAEPDNGEALVGRAIVHRYNQENKKSEQLLNRAINYYPQWSRPLHERGRLYKSTGYEADALDDFTNAKKLDPQNYWISTDRGILLFEMNKKTEALEEFEYAIGIDPAIFLAYVYSAGLKNEKGDYQGAEADFTKLAKLRPDYYFASEGLGMLKMKNKQWAASRDAFLEAYKYEPKEMTYAFLAIINWMRAGKITDPKQYIAQLIKTVQQNSLNYSMLRLFHDLSGEADVAAKVEHEKDIIIQSRMLFYLACYHDIRGNKTLADRYYLLVRDTNAEGTVEWQLNEWILEEKGLGQRKKNE